MSDTPQGHTWWQASDGRWYPPEQHPSAQQAHVAAAPPYPVHRAHKGGAGKVILAVVLALVLVGGGLMASTTFFAGEAAADVQLEPIGADRADAFTAPVAPEPAGSLLDYAERAPAGVSELAETRQTGGYQALDGSVPGVYGGSLNEAACDPDQLVAFLAAEPDKAEVWADVLQIDPSDIPAYVDTLTPVNLDADTRVLNHGFRDGEATSRDAVLQRGSAVLVDRRGVPRVDCYSGSPLLEPTPVEGESFTGVGWPNFGSEGVIVVMQASAEITEFELVEIESGELFTRPVGSRGEDDRPAAPDVAETVNVAWNANVTAYRSRNGERFSFVCPPGGSPHTVWGTDVYTDDSSVCTAAVHAGRITFDAGGAVLVEIRPGEDSYDASERNGVSTSSWPSWSGSFVFP